MKAKNEKDMLFLDSRREEYWERVRTFLDGWRDGTCLDVCCGFGQFAKMFNPDNYSGIDFSEAMRNLAVKKNNGYLFEAEDGRTFIPRRKYDIVFEVNSLHSMKWDAKGFIEHYKPYANKAVACLEADNFTVYYVKQKRTRNYPQKYA